MIRQEKIEGLILSRRSIGEADRLVRFFSRSQGLLQAVAKGVRKIPSQRGGHLEPLTRVTAIISQTAAGRYVMAVETIDHYPRLHEDVLALAHAKRLSLLVSLLLPEGEPQAQLYDALQHAWQVLPALAYEKQAQLEIAGAMLALQAAGVLPELKGCSVCGISTPQEAIVLDGREGRWRCLSCHSGFQGTEASLPPRLLQALKFLATRPHQALRLKMEREEVEQLLEAMRTYLGHVIGKPVYAQ